MAAHPLLKLSVDSDDFADNIREYLKASKKDLSAGTLKNYPSQLKRLLIGLGVKTVADALKKTADDYKEALKDVTVSTRSTLINAMVATLKACDIKTNLKFDDIKKLNIEIGHQKMEAMKDNEGDIPADFDKKVKAYLAANKGSLNAVIIALMALSPTIRGHMMEGVVIARGEEEYERIKTENKSPVIGVIGSTYKFIYVAGNRDSKASAKVKDIREETVYSGAVAEQLKAFIKPGQKYMFEPKKGKTEYVSTKTFNDWITEAFEAAGLPEMGVQKLRRIYETRISTNPTMSVADKEKLSRQMNHSRMMGENYVIIPKGKSPAEQKVIDSIGIIISGMMVKLVAIKDIENLQLMRQLMIAQSDDMDDILKYESIADKAVPTAPPMPPMPSAKLLAKSGKKLATAPPGVPLKKAKDITTLNF